MNKSRTGPMIAVGTLLLALTIFAILGISTGIAQGLKSGDLGNPSLAATRVELRVPAVANLGDTFPVSDQFLPTTGPLPIFHSIFGMGQTISGTTGYGFSGFLKATVVGQQIPITVTAVQASVTYTDSKKINVVGPQGVTIEAPASIPLNQEVVINSNIIGWDGTAPVTRTWTISDQNQIVNVGGPSDSVSVTWNTPGTKRIAVRACVLGYCFDNATEIIVEEPQPPALTISWTAALYYIPAGEWGTNITLTLNTRPPVDQEVWATIDGMDRPVPITQTVTVFTIYMDTSNPGPCSRSKVYRLLAVVGAQILEPSMATVYAVNNEGRYECLVYLPLITHEVPLVEPTPTLIPTPVILPTPTATPVPNNGYVQRINVGGAAYRDTQGRLWSADKSFTNGSWGYFGGSIGSSVMSIANTPDPTLYRTDRNWPETALVGYRFTVPNGRYQVALKFAELFMADRNRRVFSIRAEGQMLLENFDIFAEAGKNVALDKTFTVNVTDGELTLGFIKIVDRPKVNAIEVISLN